MISTGRTFILDSHRPFSYNPTIFRYTLVRQTILVNTMLTHSGLGAPGFHTWISNLTPQPFALHTPFNPIPLIATIGTILVGSVGTYALRNQLIPLAQSRIVWGAASILLILVFTSGHMWNRIKNAPYVQVSREGTTSWIAGGYQNQLGLESQVVAALCTC